jgi:hypothetical protein
MSPTYLDHKTSNAADASVLPITVSPGESIEITDILAVQQMSDDPYKGSTRIYTNSGVYDAQESIWSIASYLGISLILISNEDLSLMAENYPLLRTVTVNELLFLLACRRGQDNVTRFLELRDIGGRRILVVPSGIVQMRKECNGTTLMLTMNQKPSDDLSVSVSNQMDEMSVLLRWAGHPFFQVSLIG